MDNTTLVPNIIAMVFSLIATILLTLFTTQITDKIFSRVINLIVIGIYLAVTAHAAFELMGAFGWIDESTLLIIMGTLLSSGSALFILAGYIGINNVNK